MLFSYLKMTLQTVKVIQLLLNLNYIDTYSFRFNNNFFDQNILSEGLWFIKCNLIINKNKKKIFFKIKQI
jgi:hypothetical protein